MTIVRRVLPALALASAAFALPAEAADLALKRVVLSSGGVGYFEYQATVTGSDTLALDVRLDQVDDVLKSVVVFDSAGRIGNVSLPGREPLLQAFRDLPFGPEALGAPDALLQALQGARIRVTGQRSIEGRIVSVVPEQVALPDGAGVVVRHRLGVLTEGGLEQVVLEDAIAIEFLDEGLQAQIDGALAAVAENRVRDRRVLDVAVTGEGERTVTVGYVVGVPLWKVSYRAALPPEGGTEGMLQGWALLENMSGQDWQGVDLTLVSGSPVTFRQALYQAYYVDRPEVPVEVVGRVLPRLDEGAVAMLERRERDANLNLQKSADEAYLTDTLAAGAMAESAAAPAPAMASEPAQMFQANAQQAGADAATQVLFHVADPVSVAAGQSLMLPIVQRTMPMERVALYQPMTSARHPLASVRIRNDGDSGLPPGIVTLYETGMAGTATFVGDARLATLPAGDERLVSFAVDLRAIVDREAGYTQSIGKAKVHQGVLQLALVDRQTITFRVKAPANEARTVILEEPRQPGWTLIQPPEKDVELTATDYRFPLKVAAGTESKLDVVLEQTYWQEFTIADLSVDDLASYATSGDMPEAVRKALEGLVDLRHQIVQAERALVALDQRRQRLYEDQDRIRRNLDEVPQDSDLAGSYLEKLTAQEGEVEALLTERDAAETRLIALQDRLAQMIQALEL